jgi:CRISPR-associated protein Cmr4
MFDAAECMFLYLESSLRVGDDKEGIEIDLPVQREAATGYPLLPASSLKGVLRSRARAQQAPIELLGLLGSAPESEDIEPTPSNVIVSDSIPLLFPVRSLTGLFTWVTSVETLSRFGRDMAAYGVKAEPLPQLPALDAETAGVAPETPLLCRKQTLVLEEFTFPVRVAEEVGALGAWMAENAFPDDPAFDFWRSRAARGVVVLPEGAYRHFVTHGTQVVPRIRIDPDTGTASDGSLWTEEFLPPETLLYALVGANLPDSPAKEIKKAADLTEWVRRLAPVSLQLGSGRTLGHGIVRVRWTGKKLAKTAAKGSAKKK